MADVTLKVRIDGSATGMVQAGTQAERSLRGVSAAAGRAGTESSHGFAVAGRAAVNLSGEIDRVRSGALRLTAAFVSVQAIRQAAREIVDASNAVEGWRQALTAATGSQQAASQAMGFVRAEAQRLGTDLRASADAYVGLAAATKGTALEGQAARDIFSAVSEAARVLNLSAAQTSGALLALQQMVSKGTVQAEELRGQLGERIPGAFAVAARAMGVTTAQLGDMLERGEVAAEVLLPRLAAELHATFGAQAALAANTPAAEMQRLQNAILELEAAIGDAGFMAALASGARDTAEALTALTRSGALDTIVAGLGSIAALTAIAFAGRTLGRIADYAASLRRIAIDQAVAIEAERIWTAAKLQGAQATSVELTGTLEAITAARAQVIAKQQLAVAEIAASEATLAAASATTQGSFALKVQREATDQLTAARARMAAVTAELAALGRAQVGVQAQLAGAAGVQIAAQDALNTSMARGGVVMRGLRTAGAGLRSIVGGPIGAAFVAVTAGIALFAAAADQSIRSIDAEIDRLRQQNDELREQARLRKLIAAGNADEQSAGPAKAFDDARQAIARFEQQIQQLNAARKELAKFGNDTVGIDAAILGLRAQISGTIGDVRRLGEKLGAKFALTGSIDELPPKFRATAQAILDAGKRMREFLGLSRDAAEIEPPKFSDDLAKSLAERMQSLKAERLELTQGLRARLEFEALNKTGAQSVEQLDKRLRDLIDTIVAESSANVAAKTAQKAASDAREEARRKAKALTEQGRRFAEQTNQLAADLAGPAQQAVREYSSALDEAARLFAAGAISADELTKRIAVQTERLDRSQAAIAAQRAPIDQMLDDLRAESELIGLTSTEREVAIALRQAEQALIEQGIDLASAEAQKQLAQVETLVRQNEAARMACEGQEELSRCAQTAAEVVQRSWQDAVDSGIRAFSEFVADGANRFRELGRSLKAIAKSFLADLIETFIRNQLVLRIGVGGGGLGGAGAALAGGGPGGGLFGGLLGGAGGGTGANPFSGIGPLASFGGQGGGLTSTLGSIFGQNSAGTTLGGFGAAAQSALVGSLVGSLFGGKGGTGGAIGGALGAAVGGPVGAAIGSVLGGLVGGLFGRKFKTVGTGSEFSIGEGGASGFQFEDQKKKKLFGGSKRRTLTSDLDAEAQDAIDELVAAITNSVAAAAQVLAVDAPALISGSFRQEFDKAGNLKREFSTIAGRVVEESKEAFAQRLQAENILAVVAQSAPSAQQLAEPFRRNAEDLLDAARLLLSAQAAINQGVGLIGADLGATVALVQDLAVAGEPLSDAFTRIAASTTLLEEALALSGIALDKTRVEMVTFATDVTVSAGGLDAATALWRGYFDRFFSDNERAVAALEQARTAAAAQAGDIGLNASDFASAAGLQQFRALFEQALPTLAADAVVQWLEAAQAIGLVIDAQDALNQTLGQAGQVAGEATQALVDLMADIRGQASGAAIALAEFDLSPLTQSINAVARETQAAIDEATRLGAAEADLAEIRALGTARAELLQRQAQADLADLLDGVQTALFEIDASPLEIELARVQRAMADTLAQATALGASEAQLATIRELASRQSAQAVEAEAERLRAAFAQLAESIGRVRGSIAEDILSLRRTSPGFDEAAFQTGRLADLRASLDAATDPTERVDLIDQVRQATLGRYNAELAAIEQAQQAQQAAAQEAQRGIEAQREALNRLRGFVDTLGLSSVSPLTAFQRLDEARGVFDQTLARARGGDIDAIGGLQEAANALLTENRAVFGVSDVAVQEFERVRSALAGIAGQGVRGAAAISDPFQRASLETSSRIAALQASTIAELQGLDDALAMLEVTEQASTEGTIQALRDRFDQAEQHKDKIIEHIQPIFEAFNRANETGDAQVAQLQQQTAQLAGITTELQNGADVNAAFLDKFLVYAQQQETTMTALIERLGRAIERTAGSGVRL